MAHKHQAVMDAHKAGVEIQVLYRDGTWGDCSPSQSLWFDDHEYRIKPQPKEPQYLYVYGTEYGVPHTHNFSTTKRNKNYIGKIKLEDESE